jgi:hypothetical protein
MRMVLGLIGVVLVLITVLAKLDWSRKDGSPYWATVDSTCPWNPPLEGVVGIRGSCVIQPQRAFVMRVYWIDDGTKVLKDTFEIDPASNPKFYVTPFVEASGKSRVCYYGPGQNAREIQGDVEVPTPHRIRRGDVSSSVSYGPGTASRENVVLTLEMAETPEAGAKDAFTMDEKIRSSKEDPTSFVVFTCAAK